VLPGNHPGRRPILSDADKRLMKRQLLTGSCKTAADLFKLIQQTGKAISYWTVRNHLRKLGFRTRRKVKKPHL
ncbi:hypothetical protein BG011_003099, partial [Mortierella polycephala]